MRNQYPGICYRCGQRVEVGDGHFERHGGRWLVQHATCAIAWRGTDLGKEQIVERERVCRQKKVQHRLEELAQQTGKKASRARNRLRRMAAASVGGSDDSR